ncbi:MAG: hypothetical protein IIB77_14740 [Proteobacteria bacterium]|nr:hypothetical protein [Pseudomonadota bacterium]
MEQETFEFHDDVFDALHTLVARCGGPKVCGSTIWPNKNPIKAAHWLNDCINAEKPAKLDPEDLIALLTIGREKGCHTVLNYICSRIGYTQPKPQPPEDELGELYAKYINAVEYLARITEGIRTQESKVRIVG